MAVAELDQEQQDYLATLDNTTITCKASRRHDFPPLIPGRPLPKGARALPLSGELRGHCELTETCRVCGRIRRTITAPRGHLGDGSRRAGYTGGQDGYLAPPGMGLTGRDYANIHGDRMAETIWEAAQLTAKKQRAGSGAGNA